MVCQSVNEYKLLLKKMKELNDKQKTNVFLFIEVDIDECVDVYSFLKRMKRINGVPSMVLYEKNVYTTLDDEYKYIPQQCVTGADENKIKQLFDMIQ